MYSARIWLGIPSAMVSTAVSTITRGSILRYLPGPGSRTHDACGSPSWIGTAAPPVPTIALPVRFGCAVAANRAAAVPTSCATMCGVPRSASVMSWARNSPIARGDSRSWRRSDAPKPGRSTANRRACSAGVAHIGANAYTLSGQGLVSRTVGFCGLPLSAYRIRTPPAVRKRTCGVVVVGIQQSSTFGPVFEPANTLAKSLVIRPGGGCCQAVVVFADAGVCWGSGRS
jgi:hypothetical protein